MASYLEGYGVEDERRNRTLRYIFSGLLATVVLAIAAYFFLRDYGEKKVASQFLSDLNEHHYQAAYTIWCPKPCENYTYDRFAADWADKKTSSPWKVDSTDSCKAFLTVNVTADGSELQSLSVERGTKVLSFAPAPECQEYKWHWKQFFQRIFHGGSS
jgi:hypothetical protein